MAKKLVPSEFKTHLINQIIESVTEGANTAYYAFVGDHETVASSIEEVNAPIESFKKTNSEVFRNMIFGKRITASDMSFVINRHDWTAGTVYTMYDDEVQDIQEKNFYVVVNEDSFKHVYKCLFNNNGAPSVDKPLFKHAKYDADLYVAGDDYYETSDGYQWKYMYSITSTVFNKFATEKYIPVVANTVVVDNAQEGAIDVIKVDFAGKNYLNVLSGQFAQADINRLTRGLILGDTDGDSSGAGHFDSEKAAQCYRIEFGAEQTTDFYSNTIIYLTGGIGVGQFRTIEKSAYVSEVGGVIVQLDEQFEQLPNATTTYEITPKVLITGDGGQTANAAARAIIDSSASDSVSKVEILETGANYSYATANVLEGVPKQVNGVSISPTPAVVRPILSPQGGHGANTIVEFGAKRLAFYMKFDRDESGLVEPTNTFSQFGLIRDPKFANVAIYTQNTSGEFVVGEEISQFTKLRIGDANSFTSNNTLGAAIEGQAGEYDIHFDTGDHIFIETNELSPRYFLTTVGTGSTSTRISLAETPYWVSGTNITCTAYYVHEQARAIVKSKAPPLPSGADSGLLLNNADPEFKKDHTIYGYTSRNIAKIQGIDINNRIGLAESEFQFLDFNQMLRITGATSSGTFIEDETLVQGNSEGQLHSVETSGGGITLNLTNVIGRFTTAEDVVGQVSGARLDQTSVNALDIIYGDLDPNTGAILYLQNDIPVDRDENQTEEIRVILEF